MILERFAVGPLQCNCVILGDEATKRAIVIDPGDEVARIGDVLAAHGLTVAAIVATHGHIDHVGGFADLKAMTGAGVRLHEADVPLYESLPLQAEWLGVAPPAMTVIDGSLDDRGLDAGSVHLDVRHTPGHSPGSVSLILPLPVPVVFSGDTLFAGSVGRTDLWGGSFDDLMRSIRTRLLDLPDDAIVVPGHGPQTTIGAERRTNPFLVR